MICPSSDCSGVKFHSRHRTGLYTEISIRKRHKSALAWHVRRNCVIWRVLTLLWASGSATGKNPSLAEPARLLATPSRTRARDLVMYRLAHEIRIAGSPQVPR